MINTNTSRNTQRIYRLDNTANLYPAIRNKKRPGVFRVSATLYQQVDPVLLQSALDLTLMRIPGFSVRLRSGLFWHYFVHTDEKLLVKSDVLNPCTQMTDESNHGFLIRVRYYKDRIALEIFHALTDGVGAMVFLKTLVAQYLRHLGTKIPATDGVLNCDVKPLGEENSDQFQTFARNSPTRKTSRSIAYHVRGSAIDPDDIRIIYGKTPIASLKNASKKLNVTITEYLAAVYIKVLSDFQRDHSIQLKLPVKVQVPVNLRNYFETKTLRNFSAFVTPFINPERGNYSFNEIVELVHHFLHYETTKKHLRGQVAGNLRYSKNPLIRMLPLGIKNNLIYLGYQLMGPAFFTSIFSNIGMVHVPEQMKAHVKSFRFMLGPTHPTNISVAALGYKESVYITFSRVIEESEIERRFFRFLINEGIPVFVEAFEEI